MPHHSRSSVTRREPNRLWKYRKRMRFTQAQVAAIIGNVSERHIGHWECGRKLPGLVTALKLEVVYRVPIAFLFPELHARLKVELRTREDRLRARWAGRRPDVLDWKVGPRDS